MFVKYIFQLKVEYTSSRLSKFFDPCLRISRLRKHIKTIAQVRLPASINMEHTYFSINKSAFSAVDRCCIT
jgi:hypothetical protein